MIGSCSRPNRAKDLEGMRFGRLLVIAYAGPKPSKWLCRCDCGNEVVLKIGAFSQGTQSCGCLQRESAAQINRTHGLAKTPEHVVWCSMNERCTNTNHNRYHRYGGRGITVCDRWRNSFEAFLEDMGPKPSPRHTIERIDNDGHYEPGNVRWATKKEQARNRRTTRLLEIRGHSRSVAEWSEMHGVPHATILERLKRGWDAEQAVTTPVLKTWNRHKCNV